MPAMDGCTAKIRIRALSRADVEKLDGYRYGGQRFCGRPKKTREAGMNGHLAKPIDMNQLQQMLQKWL